MSSKVFSRRGSGGGSKQLDSPLKHAEPQQFFHEHHQSTNKTEHELRKMPIQLCLNMGSEKWEQEELPEEDESPSVTGSPCSPFSTHQEATGSPSKRLRGTQHSQQELQPRTARRSLMQTFSHPGPSVPSPGVHDPGKPPSASVILLPETGCL